MESFEKELCVMLMLGAMMMGLSVRRRKEHGGLCLVAAKVAVFATVAIVAGSICQQQQPACFAQGQEAVGLFTDDRGDLHINSTHNGSIYVNGELLASRAASLFDQATLLVKSNGVRPVFQSRGPDEQLLVTSVLATRDEALIIASTVDSADPDARRSTLLKVGLDGTLHWERNITQASERSPITSVRECTDAAYHSPSDTVVVVCEVVARNPDRGIDVAAFRISGETGEHTALGIVTGTNEDDTDPRTVIPQNDTDPDPFFYVGYTTSGATLGLSGSFNQQRGGSDLAVFRAPLLSQTTSPAVEAYQWGTGDDEVVSGAVFAPASESGNHSASIVFFGQSFGNITTNTRRFMAAVDVATGAIIEEDSMVFEELSRIDDVVTALDGSIYVLGRLLAPLSETQNEVETFVAKYSSLHGAMEWLQTYAQLNTNKFRTLALHEVGPSPLLVVAGHTSSNASPHRVAAHSDLLFLTIDAESGHIRHQRMFGTTGHDAFPRVALGCKQSPTTTVTEQPSQSQIESCGEHVAVVAAWTTGNLDNPSDPSPMDSGSHIVVLEIPLQ